MELLTHFLESLAAARIDALGLKAEVHNLPCGAEIAQGQVDLGKVRVGDSIIRSKLDETPEVDFGFGELLGA